MPHQASQTGQIRSMFSQERETKVAIDMLTSSDFQELEAKIQEKIQKLESANGSPKNGKSQKKP
jgi:hypothetical protein